MDLNQQRKSSALLEPFVPSETQPWDVSRAAHLLRRCQLGPNLHAVDTLLGTMPGDVVDQIVDKALAEPLPAPPAWAGELPPPRGASDAERQAYNRSNRAHYVELSVDWFRRLYDGGLRESMCLFWSNHFVTEFSVYRTATYAHQYLTLLRTHALGDFKAFVRQIGLTPSMLIYLDGVDNVAGQPNENYARELLELFTMGIGNYTEDDVKEIARALTGWQFNRFTNTVSFNPRRHDSSPKTIFGQIGVFDYDDVIDLIFQERAGAVARFVSTKLYRYFVYAEEDANVVDEMAAILLENNFAIEPVIRTLLKSAHFFDEVFYGGQIKAPVQFYLGLLRDGMVDPDQQVRNSNLFQIGFRQQEVLGQVLLNPPDVSGWPGHRDWISSASLTERWTRTQQVAGLGDTAALLATISNSSDPWIVAGEIVERLSAVPPEGEDLDSLVETLLDGTPSYEWDPESAGGLARLANYVAYLMQVPEYQLS